MPEVIGYGEKDVVKTWANIKYIESQRAQKFVKSWETFEDYQKGKEEGKSEAELAAIKEENNKANDEIQGMVSIETLAKEWYAKEKMN